MKIKLNNWTMNYREYKNIKCSVPCTMYGVLYENGLIDDPYYGINETKLTEYSDFPCEFETVFCVEEEQLEEPRAELIFYGLDTICEIYLNGYRLAGTKNMHMAYRFDVKDLIRSGENKLCLTFSSPTEYFRNMNKRHYLYSCAENISGAAHLRKGLSMSGWDWGPQLPDMGIYRPVELVFGKTGRITDFYVAQKHFENGVILNITADHAGDVDLIYCMIDGKKYEMSGGECSVLIESPRLWWPRGYGKQELYDISFEAIKNGETVDERSARIGLRTLEISRETDKDGKEFCFVVNGYKIFAMGANYIPEDSLMGRIDKARIKMILDACVDANYNCVRVWGGGYYPDDYFYELCDEYGLIVWQDFMVACANVWLSEEFEQLISAEAVYNVKRLRNHASLGLLCGNNEMEYGLTIWGVSDRTVETDYIRLYEHILPDICAKYAPQTFYWPSSPSCGGGFKDPNSVSDGDVHYWDVWHESAPFTDYRKYRFRFCSEFGFESFPSVKTIRAFCPPDKLNIFSDVMESHQKRKAGNAKIMTYLADTYLYANDFDTLVYASQLIQADAIRYGVEHFRRIRGCCMGSIYWQLNDCWPVASWSSLDYFGRYKALHYAAKRFYAPVLMSLCDEDGKVTVNISNETMAEAAGTVHYGIYDNDFNELMSGSCEYNTQKLTAENIKIIDTAEFAERNDVFFKAVSENTVQTVLFVKPKHYNWKDPNIRVEIRKSGELTEFAVFADHYARGVELDFENADIILSDNYFDITGHEPVVVTAKTDIAADVLKAQIKIKSTYDIK